MLVFLIILVALIAAQFLAIWFVSQDARSSRETRRPTAQEEARTRHIWLSSA